MKLIYKKCESLTQEEINLVKDCMPTRFKISEYNQNEESRNEMLTSSFLIVNEFGRELASTITYSEYKKPLITGKHFNVSHEKGLVVLAINDEEIGVDLCFQKRYSEIIIQRSLNDNEKNIVLNNPEAFCKIWSMKESVSKLFGLGLSMNFDTIDVSNFFNKEPINILGKTVFNYTFEKNDMVVSVSSFNPINPAEIQEIEL